MEASDNNPQLIFEEKKAIKQFLWLFFFFYYTFELLYYYIVPKFTHYGQVGISEDGLGYWLYILVFSLLPISIYMIKKGNPYHVKYLILFGNTIFEFINNFLEYFGTSQPFISGGIGELIFLCFAPVFINKKYYWTVILSIIGKYVLLGIVLQSTNVLKPVSILIILSVILYVILSRFISYINSLKLVYEELHKKEKLAVIGQMAASIGHEIRNPLSSLRGFTQLEQERSKTGKEFYPIMLQEIDRINSIVDDLMYIGKPRAIVFNEASIEEIIAYTLTITQQIAESQGIIVETTMAGPLPQLDCDEKQLKQVFLNLIKNALESMPEGGKIEVHVKIFEKHKMFISIKDTGCGISDEDIVNLIEPFFTTKKEGTGLGLMVTSQIINDHNGEIKFDSAIGKGTKVEVILPITQKNLGK